MDHELLTDLYRQMLRIRRFEEENARLYLERKISGPLYLSSGLEAISVGALSVIEARDMVITAQRCHGLYLARAGSCRAGMAEVMDRVGGCCQGQGGAQHFFDSSLNFMGGWSLMGGHLPIACGLALAQKQKSSDALTICFLDNEVTNSGAFHEALSLAALWELPVVFVIENNLVPLGKKLHKENLLNDLSIKALAYPMARASVDGSDVFAVRASIHAACKRAREQSLPTLVEAKAFRYPDPSCSTAQDEYENEVLSCNERDPLKNMGEKLVLLGLAGLKVEVEKRVNEEINDALRYAEASPLAISK